MDYKRALKEVKADKPGSNYLVINFRFGHQYIFPYKEGLSVLQAFEAAEELTSNYTDSIPSVTPLSLDTYTVNQLSAQDYHDFKIAQLLGVALKDVKNLKQEPSKD